MRHMFKITYTILLLVTIINCNTIDDAINNVSDIEQTKNISNTASANTIYYSCERNYMNEHTCMEYAKINNSEMEVLRQNCETEQGGGIFTPGVFNTSACNTEVYSKLCIHTQDTNAILYTKKDVKNLCQRTVSTVLKPTTVTLKNNPLSASISSYGTALNAMDSSNNSIRYLYIRLEQNKNYTLSAILPTGGRGSLSIYQYTPEILGAFKKGILNKEQLTVIASQEPIYSNSNVLGNPLINFTPSEPTQEYIVKVQVLQGSGNITLSVVETPIININTIVTSKFSSNDTDAWYTIKLDAGRFYNFVARMPNETSNYDLKIYNAQEVVVATGSNSLGFDENFTFVPDITGVYKVHLLLRSEKNTQNVDVDLFVQQDIFENQSSSLQQDSTKSYMVSLLSNHVYNIKLDIAKSTASEIAANINYDLCLYFNNTEIICSNNTAASTLKNELIVYKPTTSGLYKVEVKRPMGASATGKYVLSILENDIFVGANITNRLTNSDQEAWYKVSLNQNTQYKFVLYFAPNSDKNFNLSLHTCSANIIYPNSSSNCTEVASQYKAAGKSEEFTYTPANQGVYYAKISRVGTGDSYLFSVKDNVLQLGATNTKVDYFTSDDNINDSKSYQTVNLQANQSYQFKLALPLDTDFDLELYNSSNTKVASSNNGTGIVESLSYSVPAGNAQSFTVKVIKKAGNGLFRLSLLESSNLTELAVADSLLPTEENKSYNFSVTNTDLNKPLTVHLISISDIANFDLELYSPTNDLLATSKNGEIGINESLRYTPTVTGSYHIKVIKGITFNDLSSDISEGRMYSLFLSKDVINPITLDTVYTSTSTDKFVDIWYETPSLDTNKYYTVFLKNNSGTASNFDISLYPISSATHSSTIKDYSIDPIIMESKGDVNENESFFFKPTSISKYHIRVRQKQSSQGAYTLTLKEHIDQPILAGNHIFDSNQTEAWYALPSNSKLYNIQVSPTTNALLEISVYSSSNNNLQLKLAEANLSTSECTHCKKSLVYIPWKDPKDTTDITYLLRVVRRSSLHASLGYQINLTHTIEDITESNLNKSFPIHDTSHWYKVSRQIEDLATSIILKNLSSTSNFDLYYYENVNGTFNLLTQSLSGVGLPDAIHTTSIFTPDYTLNNKNYKDFFVQVVRKQGSGTYTIASEVLPTLNGVYEEVPGTKASVSNKDFNTQNLTKYHVVWLSAKQQYVFKLRMEPKCWQLGCAGYILPPADYDIKLYHEAVLSQNECASKTFTSDSNLSSNANVVATAEAQPALNETISYSPNQDGCYIARVEKKQWAWDYRFSVEVLKAASNNTNIALEVGGTKSYQVFLLKDKSYDFTLTRTDVGTDINLELWTIDSFNNTIKVKDTASSTKQNKVLTYIPRDRDFIYIIKVVRNKISSSIPENVKLYFKETTDLTIFTKTYRHFNLAKLGELLETSNLTPNLIANPEKLATLFEGPKILTYEVSTISDFLNENDSEKWYRILFTTDNLDFDDNSSGTETTYNIVLNAPSSPELELELYEESTGRNIPLPDVTVTGISSKIKSYRYVYRPLEPPADQTKLYKLRVKRKLDDSVGAVRFSLLYRD